MNPAPSNQTAPIHPTAIIAPGASIHATAEIGPYCIIGPDAKIGAHVRLHNHVTVAGDTSIGEGTEVHSFASLGGTPQSLNYKNEPTKLIIGRHNVIREQVTIHRGTQDGGGYTEIGDSSLLMVGVHIAHDCRLGNNLIMANQATLGGHVLVGDFAYIGGLSAVHPHVRIGQQSIVGGLSGVEGDVIPYGSVFGNRARLCGLNIIGMKRRKLSREAIHDLRNAYRMLFANEGTMAERMADVRALFKNHPNVAEILHFISEQKNRSLCLPKDIKESE